MPLPPSSRLRAVTITAFAVYLTLLAWAILWKLDVPSIGAAALLPRPWKLVPFVASGDAGASDPAEVLANVLLFVPFGVYLGLLATRWRWGAVALLSAGASLVLELAQHLLSTGSFDSSDVIANTAGGLVGLGILRLVRRSMGRRADAATARVSVVVTAIALLVVAGYVVSPLHVPQQQDVVATPV